MPEVKLEEGTFDARDWRATGAGWRERLQSEREKLRQKLDGHLYEREDLKWFYTAYFQYFLLAYDAQFYDRASGRYLIEKVIDRGSTEYGGFDNIMLWHSYPRIGIDERNQFDMLRDMPGGLEGVRNIVDRAHARGVKVFIPYTPWDVGTRRESVPDHEMLAEMVRLLDIDGLCLDTMNAARPELRDSVDKTRKGVVFSPEYYPVTYELAAINTGSDIAIDKRLNKIPTTVWESIFSKPENLPQKVLVIKWLESRYSVRGNLGHYPVYQFQSPFVANDFFHGMGHQIIDNLFGWWTPFCLEARTMVRRCAKLLRANSDAFLDRDWQPYVDTLKEEVFAHCWKAGVKRVYTLMNVTNFETSGPTIRIPLRKGEKIYDAWNGRPVELDAESGDMVVSLTMEPLSCGCLVVQPKSWPEPVNAVLEPGKEDPWYFMHGGEAHQPLPVQPSVPWQERTPPLGMVRIPAGRFRMKVREGLCAIEGGCYSYPDRHGHPDRMFDFPAFLMDRAEVTNSQYKEFLQSSQYRPLCLVSFLKHWQRPAGSETDPRAWKIPEGKADHPVVYVDLEDARAYARWAGKRLPTEEEWQYACQGHDGRKWPWGNAFDPQCCNGIDGTVGTRKDMPGRFGDTTPVDAYPSGSSPFGCLDMSGNVWEWTESERNDGHTRYAILRGGSYFKAGGSWWYTAGGAQPCDRHQKMLLMYPGLDRCSTVGFRCVKELSHG